MTACLLLLATLLSDAPDAVSIGQPQFVSGCQVEITLENRPELPPRQTQIELDLVYHLTPTGADTIREIRQPLGESGVPFDLSSQAAQIHPVSVAFDADQFLSVIQNSGDLTLSLCPLGKIAPLTADLGTPKQLGVDSIEPTFAAFTGALKTNDLTLAIPAAGGKHRAATLLRWHITQSATGVTATPLSDDAPLPPGVIGDATQMRLPDPQPDLSDTNSSRQELFTQTLTDQWQLSGRLMSRLTGANDLGNHFSVDLILELTPTDGGPGKNRGVTVATIDQVGEPDTVDLHPLAAAWDHDHVLLLYENSFNEMHLFIWDPESADPIQSHRDVTIANLRDLKADQFDWALARLSGSLGGDGLTITLGLIRQIEPLSIPLRLTVKKDAKTGDFSITQ